jgi:hypothetical protein
MLIVKPSFPPSEQYAIGQPVFPAPLRATSPWSALFGVSLVLGGLWIAAELFGTQPAPRRRRRYQSDPVSMADKEYVSVRDGWRCTYCGRRVTRGTRHIDHSVSRANGGTNHLNNLRVSCAACNLGKGALNSREFTRSL